MQATRRFLLELSQFPSLQTRDSCLVSYSLQVNQVDSYTEDICFCLLVRPSQRAKFIVGWLVEKIGQKNKAKKYKWNAKNENKNQNEKKYKKKKKQKNRTQNSHFMGEWKWQINLSSKEAEAAKFRSCQTQLANKSAAECKGKFKRERLWWKVASKYSPRQTHTSTHTHSNTLPTNLKSLSKLSIQFKLMRREESCQDCTLISKINSKLAPRCEKQFQYGAESNR